MSSDLWDELLEELAALEHRQWQAWSENIAQTEQITKARFARWQKFWVPYDELDEETKEHDRVWARQALDIVSRVMRSAFLPGEDSL